MELFRKNRAHELSKTIQKLFDTEGFYEELLKYDSQMDSFYNNLGMIIEYYIITRDKKMHTVEELMNLKLKLVSSITNLEEYDKA